MIQRKQSLWLFLATSFAFGLNFTTIDVPGATFTAVEGINGTDKIVGFYNIGGPSNGFVLKNGAFTIVAFPGALDTACYGINSHGYIVGQYDTDGVTIHGFLLKGGVFRTIDFPGATATNPQGINDSGAIVGAPNATQR